jgi:hypothetical protein
MTFRSFVQVFANNGWFVMRAIPIVAQKLLETKRAVISVCKCGAIQAIKLIENQGPEKIEAMRLWAGSYGITRITFGGGAYYQHKNTWGIGLHVEPRRA